MRQWGILLYKELGGCAVGAGYHIDTRSKSRGADTLARKGVNRLDRSVGRCGDLFDAREQLLDVNLLLHAGSRQGDDTFAVGFDCCNGLDRKLCLTVTSGDGSLNPFGSLDGNIGAVVELVKDNLHGFIVVDDGLVTIGNGKTGQCGLIGTDRALCVGVIFAVYAVRPECPAFGKPCGVVEVGLLKAFEEEATVGESFGLYGAVMLGNQGIDHFIVE